MPVSPTPAELLTLIGTLIPDNQAQLVTPAAMRQALTNMVSAMEDLGIIGNLADGGGAVKFLVADHNKLDGITAGAEPNHTLIGQQEAEAGTSTTPRSWSALRVAQAIAALAGGGGQGLTTYTVVQSANFTAVANRLYLIDCSGGSVNVTPPASPVAGQRFGVADARRSFSSNQCNIRFFSASQRFAGDASTTGNVAMTQRDGMVVFEYINATTGWVVVGGHLS